MMITTPAHHRIIRDLGRTESRPWCASVSRTSPVSTPTLPMLPRLRAFHACHVPLSVLIGGGSARFTTLSSRSHVIESP